MRKGAGRLPVLKAVASDVRLLILDLLGDPVANFPKQVDGDPLADGICADFIRERVSISASTASRHLAILVDAGLLVSKRKKGWTFYRRNEKHIADLVAAGFVTESQSPGDMTYVQVDVFATAPLSGNSLTVFLGGVNYSEARLQAVTREMRHFESIFVDPPESSGSRVPSRVFDLEAELPFAGHPLIGAAAVLHDQMTPADASADWEFALHERVAGLRSERTSTGHRVTLDQGEPQVSKPLPDSSRAGFARAFSLGLDDLDADLPIQVVSTGLAYVTLPVVPGAIGRAKVDRDLTDLVREAGAQFAVLFDPEARELRHWTNDGTLEDVATGSAAGVLAAYGVRHGVIEPGETVSLMQGRFTGRPSTLHVTPDDPMNPGSTVKVMGDVIAVGRGTLRVGP